MKGIMSDQNRPYESDEPWQPSHAAPGEPGSLESPQHGVPSEQGAPSAWAKPSPQRGGVSRGYDHNRLILNRLTPPEPSRHGLSPPSLPAPPAQPVLTIWLLGC